MMIEFCICVTVSVSLNATTTFPSSYIPMLVLASCPLFKFIMVLNLHSTEYYSSFTS
jgi:hypothetical protein